MDLHRWAAALAAAAVVSLSGIGAGTALAATPASGPTTVHPTPPTPVTPTTPVHPVTPSDGGGSGTHHGSATHDPSSTSGSDPVLPLVLGGLGVAVVAGGGAYALARGGAADRDRERRTAVPDVRVVTVPPVGYGYDRPRYDGPRYDGPRYDGPRYDGPRYAPRHR